MVYLLGGLTGAFLFAETWPWIEELAGKNYQGAVKINEALGLSPAWFTLLLVAAAVCLFWLAEKAEKRFERKEITSEY